MQFGNPWENLLVGKADYGGGEREGGGGCKHLFFLLL